MKEWFVKRVILNLLLKKKWTSFFSKQGQKSEKVEKGAPFVVTCHPVLNKLFSIMHKNPYLLYINQEVKTVFNPGPIQKC